MFDNEFEPIEEPDDNNDDDEQESGAMLDGFSVSAFNDLLENVRSQMLDAQMEQAAGIYFGHTVTYIASAKTLIYHFALVPMTVRDPQTGMPHKHNWDLLPLEQKFAQRFQAIAAGDDIVDWDSDCWHFSYKEVFSAVQPNMVDQNFPITDIHFHISWNTLLTPREEWEEIIIARLLASGEESFIHAYGQQPESADPWSEFINGLDEEEDDGFDTPTSQ